MAALEVFIVKLEFLYRLERQFPQCMHVIFIRLTASKLRRYFAPDARLGILNSANAPQLPRVLL